MKVFKMRAFRCDRCGQRVQDLYWEDQSPAPCPCGGSWDDAPTRSDAGVAVIDDSIEGGPRWFETLGHEPVWIESKSQLKREAEARGYVPCVRHENTYYATRRKWHDEELRDTGRNTEY